MASGPDTVLVAAHHKGLRFDLTRKLLSRGLFATLMSDGECAARLVGSTPPFARAPIAIVAQCRTALGVRRLLRRVQGLGWDPSTVLLIDPPDEVRAEARRLGARIVDDVEGVDFICDHITETLAA